MLVTGVLRWCERNKERGRFPTRQRSVLLELMMTGDARQLLSRFGVERGKIEVLVTDVLQWCERNTQRE